MKFYFANGSLDQLSTSEAKRVLLSYFYIKDWSLPYIVKKFFSEDTEIFIDSGAFSAFSSGTEVKITSYCKWVHSNIEGIEVYANLDVIGNQVLTRDNQIEMENNHLSPLPVFHIGSGFKELRRLCERYEYVAIGGMVPYMKRIKEIWEVLVKIFEIGRDNKLHGFGCSNMEALVTFPWFSIDSSTWIVGIKFGEVPIFDEKTKSMQRIKFSDWNEWRKNRRKIEELGYDWREVASNRVLNKETLLKLSRATFEKMERFLTKEWGH